MTVDIHFGKYELRADAGDSWDACDWPGDPFEDDGTHPDFSIFAGRPRRSFSNTHDSQRG